MGYFLMASKTKKRKLVGLFVLRNYANQTYELGAKEYIGSDVKKVESIETMMNNRMRPKARLDCP